MYKDIIVKCHIIMMDGLACAGSMGMDGFGKSHKPQNYVIFFMFAKMLTLEYVYCNSR
jgi:hypothetical protein